MLSNDHTGQQHPGMQAVRVDAAGLLHFDDLKNSPHHRAGLQSTCKGDKQVGLSLYECPFI